MKYRSEIDGLRALAIVPVILFHSGLSVFSGGFVGVDIFFVISGYLITQIIYEDIKRGEFSITKFYERRARRILPALFFIISISLPFSWYFLTPNHLSEFSKSIEWITTFRSNIFFYHQSGYFDGESELKPLLHTWSLSVEEQFYLFFPIYLVIFWRFKKNFIISSLGIVFLISFVYGNYKLQNNPASAFFYLSTRAWEILLGTFVGFYLSMKGKKFQSDKFFPWSIARG